MRIDILTLFPEMFEPVLATSIVGRAIAAGVVEVHLTNIRDFAKDKYRKVDDAPFGGGPGMVMLCQPIFDAVEAIRPQATSAGNNSRRSPPSHHAVGNAACSAVASSVKTIKTVIVISLCVSL